MTPSCLDVAAVTDIGCKRKNNEDSFLALSEYGLFCVADGMGGAEEGQVASKALTDALSEEFKSRAAGLDLVAKEQLARDVVRRVNVWIRNRAEERGFWQMGSTLVLALFDERTPEKGLALHAGDSRLYRFRKGALKQLTTDHSFAAALASHRGAPVDESAIPAAWRGVVTKAIGKLGNSDTGETVDLDATPFGVQAEDLFLLCSDGLTRMLPDKALQDRLRAQPKASVDALAREFVAEARKAGGDDNISVILVRILPVVTPPSASRRQD